MRMTTNQYRHLARYATSNAGDMRAQHILSTIGAMIANTWKGKDQPAIAPSEFAPWLDWPEAPLPPDPFGDPLTEAALGPER